MNDVNHWFYVNKSHSLFYEYYLTSNKIYFEIDINTMLNSFLNNDLMYFI